MNEFYRMLSKSVPPTEEMVDLQFELAQVLMGESADWETRELVRAFIAGQLHGLIHVIGHWFYLDQLNKQSELGGCTLPLTKEKKFSDEMSEEIFAAMLTILRRKEFLTHAYDWYTRALIVVPEYFRKDEWELVADQSGDLMIRLTGKKLPEKEKSTRIQATVTRS